MTSNNPLGNDNNNRFDHLREMALEIEVPLYKRFTESEACVIVGISVQTLRRLRTKGLIAYIKVSERHVQYFGWQILEYLWIQVEERTCPDTERNETSKLETIGSQSKAAAPLGAEHGLTPKLSKREELLSAQRILKKPSKS